MLCYTLKHSLQFTVEEVPLLALKLSSFLQIQNSSYVRQLNSSLNSTATQQASTCREAMRSKQKKRNRWKSTDLYQNFRDKTKFFWTHHWHCLWNPRIKCNRAENSKSLNKRRKDDGGEGSIVKFYWPLCSSDRIKACQQHLLVQTCFNLETADVDAYRLHPLWTQTHILYLVNLQLYDLIFVWNAAES